MHSKASKTSPVLVNRAYTNRRFVFASTNLVLCFLLKEKALNLLTNLLTNRRFVLVLVRFAL